MHRATLSSSSSAAATTTLPSHHYAIHLPLHHRSADEKFDGTFQTNVVVDENGGCLYVPPGIFKSTCKIDITWFPFDDQRCELKFGSWTYNGWKVHTRKYSLMSTCDPRHTSASI